MSKEKNKLPSSNITLAVWSPHSGGATTITVCLCEYLNKYSGRHIAVIDGDIYKPSIDLYMGLNLTPKGIYDRKGQGSLNLISDALLKSVFTSEVYQEITIPYKDRCRIVTGNASLSDCENIWNGDRNNSYFKDSNEDSLTYYSEILKKAKETSNIVIVDVGSNIFMDSTKFFLCNSDFVIAVVNATYPQMIPSLGIINHCAEHYSLTKEKTMFLINKYSKGSLEIQKVKELLKGWNILNKTIKSDAELYNSAVNDSRMTRCMEHDKEVFEEIAVQLGLIKEKTIFEKVKGKFIKNKEEVNASEEIQQDSCGCDNGYVHQYKCICGNTNHNTDRRSKKYKSEQHKGC